MYFDARYKPAGKAPIETPATIALERYVNAKLQDGYYGEDVAGVRVVFCDSADEARRLGREQFNWDKEQAKFLAAIRQTLKQIAPTRCEF